MNTHKPSQVKHHIVNGHLTGASSINFLSSVDGNVPSHGAAVNKPEIQNSPGCVST